MTARSFVIWITLVLPGRLFAQNVSEVQVAPPTVTVKVGERSGLLATAFDRAGNVIPTVRFIWSSNNVSVARVDNDGTVTGVAGRGAAHRAADGVLAAVRKHAGRAAGAQGRRLARGAGRRDVEVAPPRHRERRPERRDRGIVRRPGNRTGDELDRPHRHGAGGGAAK